MQSIKEKAELVKSFFRLPETRYAGGNHEYCARTSETINNKRSSKISLESFRPRLVSGLSAFCSSR